MEKEMQDLIWLPQVGSTNTYCKQHFAELADGAVVCTDNQTAGRGRLGRDWVNAAGQGLYYTLVIKRPLVQPSTLPLLSSMAVGAAVKACFGRDTRVKWPNDLLLNGKKLVGILCEGIADRPGVPGGIICGIGVNLAQDEAYFKALDLPHGTSLALQGVKIRPQQDALRLAAAMTEWFRTQLPLFGQQGFAPFLPAYRADCVNLGMPVTFEGGKGTAQDVDADGNLVVLTDGGEQRVFTGEVSVKGIYGAV